MEIGDRIISEGSMLNMTRLSRHDAGIYTCEAVNSQGAATVNITVNVHYPAGIKAVSQSAVSNPNENALLTCTATGNPLTAEHIKWERKGYDLSSATITFEPRNRTSYLLVERATREDVGKFQCVVNNGIAGETKQEVTLVVKFKPEMDSSPNLVKSASNAGQVGRLTCRIFLTDPVTSITVTNVTHNSVSLQWTPGFDGGLFSWYRIRYRKIVDESYRYEDVTPRNATTFTIHGLERNTDYVFSVMAINKIGQSKYRPDDTKATTLTSSEVGELNVVSTEYVETADVSKSVVVYVSIAGAILVLINAALVACFVFKRRSRRLKEQAGQSSKSATIEMYAPSSYNDTMTGETLSSVSEKSETYSQDGDDRQPPPIPEVPSMPNRHMMNQTDAYLMDDQGLVIPPPLDYPPPNYAVYEGDHARTLPHPHRHKDISGHSTLGRSAGKQNYIPAPSPMPPLDGSYYNMSSDRYLSYPPLIGEYLQQQQQGRTPTPPQQYGSQMPKPHLMNGVPPSPSHMTSPPLNCGLDGLDRQSAGGTLRRQRYDKMAVPPPDVTVLHQGNCNQHLPMNQTPSVKQPQSILKDPSRHKYGNQYGSPISSSTPQNSNSSQILTVQNLTSDVPQYGTIKKENKKQNVTIDESYIKRSETHVV
ncbi:jg8291 [Pararge aegeria aegeria]|uniref:Jg8291 protein n=1 Tax=Pararge aegeria aegeria TaxID=348720 RepID=A0A8S4R816_9NEOP|nr:jg8291 [Pararge aegeria aegeria]